MGKTKTVSLVLGSGGARGYAHIGAIEELERAGYKIVSVSGSSMGALIGALYACGNLEAYKEWVLGLDTLDVASLVDISWDRKGGIFRGKRVLDKLYDLIGGKNIENLPIKYTAVATDLKRNKEVWFQEGDLLQAVRASISIPSVFSPMQINSMLLVDGGVLNPLPVAPTMADHTDLTVAVNLYANLPKPIIDVPKHELDKQSGIKGLIDEMIRAAQGLVPKTADVTYDLFDVIGMTLDSIQQTLISYHLGNYPPDILVNISKDICGTFDFHKAYPTIEAGRTAAREALLGFIVDQS